MLFYQGLNQEKGGVVVDKLFRRAVDYVAVDFLYLVLDDGEDS